MVATGLWTGESLVLGILMIDIGLLLTGYVREVRQSGAKPPAAR